MARAASNWPAQTSGWCLPASTASEISRVLRDGYDVGRLNEGMKALRKELNLDYLFIDTHPGLNEETLLSIAISDILLIILRPDQQDFQGTAVTVDIARGLDVPNLFLVVNKALITATNIHASGFADDIEARPTNAQVAGVLPLTEDMADMGSADIFSLRSPTTPGRRRCAQICRHHPDSIREEDNHAMLGM